MHEVARRGFGREADAYERSRPSYPPDAVAWLVENLRLQEGAIVADLAAATHPQTRGRAELRIPYRVDCHFLEQDGT